jgi:pyruvate/2-oxoglutarate dehydrogenase complex dihydrolipoamide dehydrogenase (E3) component
MTHVIIIGAYGSAGVSVAQRLVDEDVELTLVDDGEPGGGLCILRGCMPSKEVLSASAHRYQARHDDRLLGSPPDVDLERTVARKDDHVSTFAAHRRATVADLAARENVEFIPDTARFVDEHTVSVGDREIEGDYVVIATGSTPSIPNIDGIDEVEFMTSADVLDATTLPDSGIVMGFGNIGIELAPYLVEAGEMDLTIVEHDERPLSETDPSIGDELMALYREDFDIDILTNTHEQAVESTPEGVRLTIEQDGEVRTIESEQLFVFTGRRPVLDGLGLEHTSLEPDSDWVHDTMQARDDEQVFVVGDANDREPVLHVAKEQGERAAKNVLRHCDGLDLHPYERITHRVIFSGLGVYPVARVGHTAASAREAGIAFVVVERQASDDGVFLTKDTPAGLARLVVATDGTVLGYQGLHYHADVMAKTMQVVVEGEMDVRDVPDRAYHPTTPEIIDGLLGEAKRKLKL